MASGAVQLALDSSGAIEEVVRAERPFWKKAQKWLGVRRFEHFKAFRGFAGPFQAV